MWCGNRNDLQVCVDGGWECLDSRCLRAGLKNTEKLWNIFVLSPGHLGLKLPAWGGDCGCVSIWGIGGGVHTLAYPINIHSTPELATLSTPTLLELHSRRDINK